MSMKNSDTIRYWTRDLPACRAVPQPTATMCAPNEIQHWNLLIITTQQFYQNFKSAVLKIAKYHIYLNIRQEFFPHSSPEKWEINLQLCKMLNKFCIGIFWTMKTVKEGCIICSVISYLGKYVTHYGKFIMFLTLLNNIWTQEHNTDHISCLTVWNRLILKICFHLEKFSSTSI
jgi:hypothetical protein